MFTLNAKDITDLIKHIFQIVPKKCLAILILTLLFIGVLLVFKTNYINFLKSNMFDISFNTKQHVSRDFYKTLELHIDNAISKIAKITQGEGNFLIEYIIWDEVGTLDAPDIKTKLVSARGFDFEINRAIDVKNTWLKNRGEKDPQYTDKQSIFLTNTTGEKADHKTIEDYAVAGIGVEEMFLTESIVGGQTFYGNFIFEVSDFYGSTVMNSAGNRQGRFIMLTDKKASSKIDIYNPKEDTGLIIMQDLKLDFTKAVHKKD